MFGDECRSDEEKGRGIIVQVGERKDVKNNLEKSQTACNSEIFNSTPKSSMIEVYH